jgi:hypothetical protein
MLVLVVEQEEQLLEQLQGLEYKTLSWDKVCFSVAVVVVEDTLVVQVMAVLAVAVEVLVVMLTAVTPLELAEEAL